MPVSRGGCVTLSPCPTCPLVPSAAPPPPVRISRSASPSGGRAGKRPGSAREAPGGCCGFQAPPGLFVPRRGGGGNRAVPEVRDRIWGCHRGNFHWATRDHLLLAHRCQGPCLLRGVLFLVVKILFW